jgi:hypothetical protein
LVAHPKLPHHPKWQLQLQLHPHLLLPNLLLPQELRHLDHQEDLRLEDLQRLLLLLLRSLLLLLKLQEHQRLQELLPRLQAVDLHLHPRLVVHLRHLQDKTGVRCLVPSKDSRREV